MFCRFSFFSPTATEHDVREGSQPTLELDYHRYSKFDAEATRDQKLNMTVSRCARLQERNAGTNNGNITSWSAAGNQTFSRTYTYDSLNRIATMADSASAQSCKGLSWTIDPWGNRTDQTVTAGACNTFHQAVDTSNRLLGAPFQYDAAGNMIHDASHSYT